MNDATLNVLITSISGILTALIAGVLTAYTQISVEKIKAEAARANKESGDTIQADTGLKKPVIRLTMGRIFRSVNWPLTIMLTFIVVVIVIGLLYLRTSPLLFEQVEYTDFETIADRQEWTNTPLSLLSLSTEQHFSGSHSLAISTSDTTTNANQVLAHWNRQFTNEIVIGQVYWPNQQGVAVQWAQVCIGGTGFCRNFPTETNQWNSFVTSFYGHSEDDKANPEGLYIQAGIKMDGTGSDTYTFFLDGVQIVRVDASGK